MSLTRVGKRDSILFLKYLTHSFYDLSKYLSKKEAERIIGMVYQKLGPSSVFQYITNLTFDLLLP